MTPEVKIDKQPNAFSGKEYMRASVVFPWNDEVTNFGGGVESGPPEVDGRGETASEAMDDLVDKLTFFADQLEYLAKQARATAEKIKSFT